MCSVRAFGIVYCMRYVDLVQTIMREREDKFSNAELQDPRGKGAKQPAAGQRSRAAARAKTIALWNSRTATTAKECGKRAESRAKRRLAEAAAYSGPDLDEPRARALDLSAPRIELSQTDGTCASSHTTSI